MPKCDEKTSCAAYMRRGECACSKCERHEGVPEDNEPAEPDVREDDYGNSGAHIYRIRLKRTVYEDAFVDIAADNEDDAIDLAENLNDVDYEEYDSEYDSELDSTDPS